MADFAAVPGRPQGQAPIRMGCRLHPQEILGVRGPLEGMGELELENLSPGAVEIRYQMSPLQYLELTVTGPSGAVVSEGHFGDRFSPMAAERVLRLQPGEKFSGQVALLATVPREKRSPGVYRVQAVYEYNGIRAVSDPVPVTVP
jgi:hypothetical protein